MRDLVIKKTGEEQRQQIRGDGYRATFGREIGAVQVVDAAHAGVGGYQLIGEVGDFHAGTVNRTRRGGARAELEGARHGGGGVGGGDAVEATQIDGAFFQKTG